MKWRLIIDKARDAYTNMAIDLALTKLIFIVGIKKSTDLH